jgi:hypothetical protein
MRAPGRSAPNENSIRRACGRVEATITWPIEWKDWDSIPTSLVRNRIRDLMDEAVDLIASYTSTP